MRAWACSLDCASKLDLRYNELLLAMLLLSMLPMLLLLLLLLPPWPSLCPAEMIDRNGGSLAKPCGRKYSHHYAAIRCVCLMRWALGALALTAATRTRSALFRKKLAILYRLCACNMCNEGSSVTKAICVYISSVLVPSSWVVQLFYR